METTETQNRESIVLETDPDARDVRAVTQYLTVLDDVTAPADTPSPLVADGGEITVAEADEMPAAGPTFTYHREPTAAGGATYVRCEECHAEAVPADPDRLTHRAGCSAQH
ncbi:hypothetical protein [Halopelagius fulvigenes]|uniref:DUF8118 domain-containing protein n=1 Tax=Halopelagius fulvigenes TaxID=1198324 RepID=A0ABD5TSR8_9EURY